MPHCTCCFGRRRHSTFGLNCNTVLTHLKRTCHWNAHWRRSHLCFDRRWHFQILGYVQTIPQFDEGGTWSFSVLCLPVAIRGLRRTLSLTVAAESGILTLTSASSAFPSYQQGSVEEPPGCVLAAGTDLACGVSQLSRSQQARSNLPRVSACDSSDTRAPFTEEAMPRSLRDRSFFNVGGSKLLQLAACSAPPAASLHW